MERLQTAAERKLGSRLAMFGAFVSALSAAVAIVSLWNSQVAVDLGKQAMEVSERAYLSVRNGRTMLKDPDRSGSARLEFAFDVHNTGNSPAHDVTYELDPSTRQFGWGFSDGIWRSGVLRPSRVQPLGTVPPSGLVEATGHLTIALDDRALAEWKGYRDPQPGKPRWTNPDEVTTRGKVTYRDEFGETHIIQWCWLTTREGKGFPVNCT